MADAAPPPLPPDIAAQNKGPAIIAICATVTALATLFVVARLFVRARIMGKLHLDDYLILISSACAWAALGINVKAVDSGNGRHFSTLTPDRMSGAILWTIVGFCPGIMSFALPKLAVVALLTRIMNPSRLQAVFMWTISVICLCGLLGCVALLFAQCTPSRSQWDFSVKGTCWSPWVLVHYALFAGSFSAFVDLYLAAYPAIVLFRLQMSIRKKLALSCALGIGSIAAAVAIYKTTRLPSLASPDFSYETSDLTVWTAIEGSVIIIAACIPLLQPLLDLMLGHENLSSAARKKRSKYQRHDSSRSENRQQRRIHSAVELSRAGGPSRKRGKNDIILSDLESAVYRDETIAGDETSHSDGKGSEESIVGNTRVVGETKSEWPMRGPLPPPAAQEDGSRGILRTDVVTVSYDRDPAQKPYQLPKQLREAWK